MACAVWPALKTLIITGNPIISLNKGNLVEYQDMYMYVYSHVGLPPLIQHELVSMVGIIVIRSVTVIHNVCTKCERLFHIATFANQELNGIKPLHYCLWHVCINTIHYIYCLRSKSSPNKKERIIGTKAKDFIKVQTYMQGNTFTCTHTILECCQYYSCIPLIGIAVTSSNNTKEANTTSTGASSTIITDWRRL